MKAAWHQWLGQLPATPGLLACGVRLPDRTGLSRSWSAEFPSVALENAWRCIGDTFDVLQLHHLPNHRLRWVFASNVLYCERRADGACLGIFTTRDPWGQAVTGLEPIVAEFHALG